MICRLQELQDSWFLESFFLAFVILILQGGSVTGGGQGGWLAPPMENFVGKICSVGSNQNGYFVFY